MLAFVASPSRAVDVAITYLERIVPAPPTLSNLAKPPEDLGRAGAELGAADIATTAKFLGHTFVLETVFVDPDQDIESATLQALNTSSFLVVHAPVDDVLRIADLAAHKNAVVFNASEQAILLRNDECRANMMHTIPSRAMLADALAQFGVKKRWNTWAMIVGPKANDILLAEAVSNSAKKFGITIAGSKNWTFDTDLRRSAAQEVPIFTQDLPDHDLLVVTDEINDFARYAQYNTWLPRPLAGSTGISPVAWSGAVEQYGAAQLQSRFRDLAGRDMQSEDYGAYLALAAIGEAVTRTNTADIGMLRDYMLSDSFELGGFKGRPLSFRNWNGQMRQPIPLVHPGAVVALAPLEGFLHQVNELDTLGSDQPTSTCTAFSE